MARKPVIRPSYKGDSQYLLRLAHAIEADTSRSVEWRQETAAILRHLVSRFNNYVEENSQARAAHEAQDCFSEAIEQIEKDYQEKLEEILQTSPQETPSSPVETDQAQAVSTEDKAAS